jgi:prolyl oligopeptidase
MGLKLWLIFQDLCGRLSISTVHGLSMLTFLKSLVSFPTFFDMLHVCVMQYVVLSITEGCDPVNRLYYCDLTSLPEGLRGIRGEQSMLPFKKLVDNFEAQYNLVSNDGPVFTFLTNKDAPKYKVIRVDLNNPGSWSDVIPESNTDVLTSVKCVNEKQLLLCYLNDVKHVLQIHDLETGDFQWRLPLEIGTVADCSGSRKQSEIFFTFTSFLTPGTVYRCDLSDSKPEVKILREAGPANFDRSMFETEQVYFLICHIGLLFL